VVVAANNPALNNIQQILVRDIRIDGIELNISQSELKQVLLTNQENEHEMVLITTLLTRVQIDNFIGKRIQFKYGPRSKEGSFYGYVVTLNPNQEYKADSIVDILCLGMTWPLQSGLPRYVTDSTASDLFGDIVTGYKLGCQVDDHPYKWPVLAQTVESDWEFLQTLATRLGFCIYFYKGIVRLVDPMRIISSTGVYESYTKADDVLDIDRELIDFSPTTQSLKLRENVRPTYGYFDRSGSPVIDKPSTNSSINPLFLDDNSSPTPIPVPPFRMSTDTPIVDEEMAEVYSESWTHRIDFWNHQAVARIHGDADIVPGVLVSIQISNSSSGKNVHDGIWMVRGIRHSFTNNAFQTELVLARDTINRKTGVQFDWFYGTGNVPKINYDDLNSYWVSNWEPTTQHISGKQSPVIEPWVFSPGLFARTSEVTL
jgi:hypothetical protein